MFDSILSYLKRRAEVKDAPQGVCPNCWGRQEYSGQFFDAMKNEGVDVNNASDKKGWVQDYADKHLAGIKLEEQDGALICQKCKVTYRPS